MPERERLRQQFETNRSNFERARANADTVRKRWRTALGGFVISGGLFIGGAAVESGTKFFKDSIPPRIKEEVVPLCGTVCAITRARYNAGNRLEACPKMTGRCKIIKRLGDRTEESSLPILEQLQWRSNMMPIANWERLLKVLSSKPRGCLIGLAA
jgi:hypothetical protein